MRDLVDAQLDPQFSVLALPPVYLSALFIFVHFQYGTVVIQQPVKSIVENPMTDSLVLNTHVEVILQ
jgi:hypothetical protein